MDTFFNHFSGIGELVLVDGSGIFISIYFSKVQSFHFVFDLMHLFFEFFYYGIKILINL